MSNDDDDDEEEEVDERLSESLSLPFPFFALVFFTLGETFLLAPLLLSTSLLADLRDSSLLLVVVLSLSVDSVTLLSSADDVDDGDEAEACLFAEVPFAFLLMAGLAAAAGLFTSFFFGTAGATTGCGEGIAAGDTDLELVELVSLSMTEEDVVVVSLAKDEDVEDDE